MNQETKQCLHCEASAKQCKNCSKDFIIEPEDFNFYEKIDVPPPTYCPKCRQKRRYAWRNERTLYRRNCDLCKKNTVSIYGPKSPFKIYCSACWFGDGWDAAQFARYFDFNRGFFEQFRELQLATPRVALLTKNGIRSDYVNHANNNKDCYLSCSIMDSENVLYSTNIWHGARDSMDCYHLDYGNDLMYESLDCEKCYGCQYTLFMRDCRECYYSYDLRGCSNCFLCSNLRQRQYCFRNEQLTKEEYEERIKQLQLGSNKTRAGLYSEWQRMMSEGSIHKYAKLENCVNVTGNMVLDSKNAQHVFDGDKMEEVKYGIITPEVKDSMDLYHVGFESELMYECHALIHTMRVFFTHLSYHNHDLAYCDSCHNSGNLFGCVGLRKKEFHILNKQYEKTEYEELKKRIIDHMRREGEYGEFFPIQLSPFAYNETVANVYMPLREEEALREGYRWENDLPGTFGKETLKPESIPDQITDVGDEIVKEVLQCTECTRNYNIVKPELELYRRFKNPIPRLCSNCRYVRRIKLRPPRELFEGRCHCKGASSTLHDHGNEPCRTEFLTPYAPSRRETVYCKDCYQKEIT